MANTRQDSRPHRTPRSLVGWIVAAFAASVCGQVSLNELATELLESQPGLQDPFGQLLQAGAQQPSEPPPVPPELAGLAPGGDATEDVAGDTQTPPAPAAPSQEQWSFERIRDAVSVNPHDLVDLHVADAPLATVLQVLSIESERNIVAGNGVEARITADLHNVSFYEALDAILHVNGFGYVERGGFIYVYTQEQLDAEREANRRRITRVITLDYLNSADAGRFVAPLLSPQGTITTPGVSEEFSIPENTPVGKDNYPGLAVLVVNDFEENVLEIEDLVAELDTRPTQILVEATILQTTLDEANAFGVDFSIIADLDFDNFLAPLDAVDNLIQGQGQSIASGSVVDVAVPGDGEGRAITTAVGDVTGAATLKAGIIDEDVGVFLRLLDEVTDITVVSNPKLLTLNRQVARVLVGTRVGYLNTTTTETATTQTVEFLDTGTQLHLRPFVTRDNLIRLELKPQVSTFRPRATVSATGDVVTIPDEDTTELVTNIIVRDGQTVVLGGLFTETTTATRRQVPVLGDVPIIGAAFRGHDDSTSRSEFIFLVTPSIVNDNDLTLEGARATAFIEHARVGARQGLLPWSRERQVGQLLVEAERLARDGRTRKARLKVQRALALHPQASDAVALREALFTGSAEMPSRSMLDGILEGVIDGFDPDAPLDRGASE